MAEATQVADDSGRIWNITVRQLSSGYWHVRGDGVCNWAQPPYWPCNGETLRQHGSDEVAEGFFEAASRLARSGEERE